MANESSNLEDGLTFHDRMIRAKIRLRQFYPFLAYLAVYVEPVENKSPQDHEGTGIGIDGRLHYRTDFIQRCSDDTLMAVIAHGTLHLALGHPNRGIGRDWLLFGIAADLVVNDILGDEGLSKYLPSAAVKPKNHGFKNEFLNIDITDIDRKSVEQIYDELVRQRVPEKISEFAASEEKKSSEGGVAESEPVKLWEFHTWSRPDNPNNNPGGRSDFNEDAGKSEGLWLRRMLDAEIECRARGDSINARIREILNTALAPRIPWHIYLQEFVEKNVISDSSFRRPRRSSQATGICLPSVTRENIIVYFHIDSSGSVHKDELELALSELRYMMNSHSNIKSYVIVCDRRIRDIYEFEGQSDEIISRIRPRGGGGTSHSPVVDWINNNSEGNGIFISFTDGISNIPGAFRRLPSEMPRLVVLTGICDIKTETEIRGCADVVTI